MKSSSRTSAVPEEAGVTVRIVNGRSVMFGEMLLVGGSPALIPRSVV